MAKTIGSLKVTDAEYSAARYLAWERSDALGEQAYQLTKYCKGCMYIRSEAEQALAYIRAQPAKWAEQFS